MVHCFLGHPVNKILQEDPVYDWWADYETERFLKKISGNGKKIKKTISFMDSMDILEEYENVYGSKSLVRMSRRSEEIAKNLEIVGKNWLVTIITVGTMILIKSGNGKLFLKIC